jgi:pimeloyl-ACP methyl ester carboxylesterase
MLTVLPVRRLALGIVVTLCACANPRSVRLDDTTLPTQVRRPAPSSCAGAAADAWAQLDCLVQRADTEPAVYPTEEKFKAIAPAIVALGYLAPDMGQKIFDQRLPPPPSAPGAAAGSAPPPWERPGLALPEACANLPPARAERSVYDDYRIGNPPEPTYTSVWLPLSRGGVPALDPGVQCTRLGTITPEARAADAFCLHARVALQPRDSGAPLVLVVHGLFDSSDHHYLRNTGSVLYSMGLSVALLDMRDHGETLRRNPDVPLTLGVLEGHDLRHLARQFREACGPRVGALGVLGYSGGGLASIRAYSTDKQAAARGEAPQFDLGVLAISPVLDANVTLEQMREWDDCAATTALEFDTSLKIFVGAVSGLVGFSISSLASSSPTDKIPWLEMGVGVGAGVAVPFLVDGFFDGRSYDLQGNTRFSSNCVAKRGIADLFRQLFDTRWRSLAAHGYLEGQPEEMKYEDYLEQRYERHYGKNRPEGLPEDYTGPVYYSPEVLAAQIQQSQPEGWKGRLAIVTSRDDVVVGLEPAERMKQLLQRSPDARALVSELGSHTAYDVLNQVLSRQFLDAFFCHESSLCRWAPAAVAVP